LSGSGFYQRYKDAIRFNRNIIIAGAGSLLVGALVSQLYAGFDENNLADAAAALAAEYSVYIPAFALLFYLDNRKKYVDPVTGERDGKKIRGDIKKLLATFSVSEVIYSAVKVGAQYQLLQSGGAEAYAASTVASVLAWLAFMVAVNTMAKATRLLRHREK
jgi:hypothetical protein